MKFALAIIAFAAFTEAGVVKDNDEPITAKDIDKLLNDLNKYLDVRAPFTNKDMGSMYFQHGNVEGQFALYDVSMWSGVSKEFTESVLLEEKLLSITIGAMRSGIHAEGKIHFVGSGSGKDFDENGTFSLKWDDVAFVLSSRFLLDEKSIQLDKTLLMDLLFDHANISIQGVKIDEMTQEDQEAAVLDTFGEFRNMNELNLMMQPEETVHLINKNFLRDFTPRELYNLFRRAIPSS